MTREQLLADIDRATSALASRAAQQNVGTGIPRPPSIEVNESSLETQPFNFELNSTSNAQAGPGGGGGGGGPPPTPSEWACCHDGTCEDMSFADCVTAGGTYNVGQHCTDNPCFGACCSGADCVEGNEVDCVGVFKGIGVPCDPNPCLPLCCETVFSHAGLFYLGKRVCFDFTSSLDSIHCTSSTNICSIITIDPITCLQTVTCTGSYTITDDGGSDSQTWILGGDGFCVWSGAGDDTLPSPFSCATCAAAPPGCPPLGHLQDFVSDCTSSCSEAPPQGSQDNSVTVTYFNQCLPP